MAYPDDYSDSQKAYLETAREFGQLQRECARLRKERDEARSKLEWLELKLSQEGLWTNLVKRMEAELGND
jgi:hypothetical protein